MKILFYTAFGFSLVQLLFFLCVPMGGPHTIMIYVKNGFFGAGNSLYTVPMADHLGLSISTFNTLNRVVAISYFGSILLCSLTPLLYKIKPRLKYKIGIALGLITVAIFIVGKLIL